MHLIAIINIIIGLSFLPITVLIKDPISRTHAKLLGYGGLFTFIGQILTGIFEVIYDAPKASLLPLTSLIICVSVLLVGAIFIIYGLFLYLSYLSRMLSYAMIIASLTYLIIGVHYKALRLAFFIFSMYLAGKAYRSGDKFTSLIFAIFGLIPLASWVETIVSVTASLFVSLIALVVSIVFIKFYKDSLPILIEVRDIESLKDFIRPTFKVGNKFFLLKLSVSGLPPKAKEILAAIENSLGKKITYEVLKEDDWRARGVIALAKVYQGKPIIIITENYEVLVGISCQDKEIVARVPHEYSEIASLIIKALVE